MFVVMALAMVGMSAVAKEVKYVDPNPFADYGQAMKSTPENPSAAEWADMNASALSAATDEERLAEFASDVEAAGHLLDRLQGAYATDPIAACQIAAVTQWVMQPDPWYHLFWDGPHAAGRGIWTRALVEKAESTADDYVRRFCLDQLRWCGCLEQGEMVRQLFAHADSDGFVPLAFGRDGLTAEEYGDFLLRFEFRMSEEGDSGLGIRMTDPTADPAYHAMCEIQLLDDGAPLYWQRMEIKPYQFTGSVFGVFPALRDSSGKTLKKTAGNGSYAKPAGEWNFMEVWVVGSHIRVYLNGILVTDGDVAQYRGDGDTPDGRRHPGLHNRRGRIGWLGHGDGTEYRNVRIRELTAGVKVEDIGLEARKTCPEGFVTLFGGRVADLDKWKGVTTSEKFDNPVVRQSATAEKRARMQEKADADMRKHWSVRNGALFFDGFKGGYSLATAKDYSDFELLVDWRILSVRGDSGLYLRGSPQVQIWDAHNQWHIGSGGLFNNKKNPRHALEIADHIVGTWNTFRIRMIGERVSVWLNGVLVVDNVTLENFWDRAQAIFPKEQIELQCHGDPVEFRNIFIREL